MTENKERLDREIGDFTTHLIPFGWADIKAAIEAALEAEHDGDRAAEQIEEYMDDVGTPLKDIDVVAVVYDSLLQEARTDIENATKKDILNDTKEQIEVAGNYMCTSLDYSEKAQAELKEIMSKIPKEDFTPAMKWLWENADLSE